MFTAGDVERVLLRLGIEGTERNSNITALCPMHKAIKGVEDSNPSWGIHIITGAHNCFSCGYKGNLLSLISDVLELDSISKAREWLDENVEVDWDRLSASLEEARNSYQPIPRLVDMSDARLSVFQDVPEWAASNRKLTLEACKKHEILWRHSDSTWILPVRTEAGKLLGWQEKGELTRRFFNRPPGITKSSTLFSIDKFEGGTMVVVESPLDVVRLSSLGIDGGVAVMGAIVSKEQLTLMRKADVLILALDNDATGKESTRLLFKALREQGMEFSIFNYGNLEVKDIGDMDLIDIQWGIDNAKHCVMGEEALD